MPKARSKRALTRGRSPTRDDLTLWWGRAFSASQVYWLRERAPKGPEEALRVKAGVLAAAGAIERVQDELRSL